MLTMSISFYVVCNTRKKNEEKNAIICQAEKKRREKKKCIYIYVYIFI
jgi:hypothetical protein